MNAHSFLKLLACSSLSLTFLGSCGVVSTNDLKEMTGQDTGSKKAEGPQEQTEVNIKVEEKEVLNLWEPELFAGSESFSLVDATAFKVDIVGCASGYTADDITSVAATKAITLYKTDLTCTATLTEFSFGGATYTGSVGGAVGTAAIFTNGGDATDKVTVRVHEQLPSPLTDASTATFVFQQIKKRADHDIITYTHSETLAVYGVEAPNLTIDTVTLDSIAVDGKATFSFTMLCGAVVTQAGADWICPSASADNEKFIHMKAKLVTDTYTADEMTYAEAATAMGAATVVDVTNGMKVAGNKFTISLTGTGALYTNKTMMLIISYTDAANSGTAYSYYNVDIGNP